MNWKITFALSKMCGWENKPLLSCPPVSLTSACTPQKSLSCIKTPSFDRLDADSSCLIPRVGLWWDLGVSGGLKGIPMDQGTPSELLSGLASWKSMQ